MRAKKTPKEIWDEYTTGNAYNAGINLYETVKQNENFFVGRQWEGVNAPDLDKPVMNVLKRVISYFIATIVSDDVTAKAGAFTRNPKYNTLMQAVNNSVDEVIETTALKAKNREVLRNAAVDGDGCMHFYFDAKDGIATDVESLTALEEKEGTGGDIVAEVIENTNIMFGNPQLCEVEKQPYILLVYRRQVEAVREQAQANGAENANGITPDEAPEGLTSEGEAKGKVTVVRKYWKENGTVHCMEVTQNAVVMPEKDLGYKLYPVAYISWDKVKNSYHGQAAVTGLIPNQIFINKLFAMAMEHMKHHAFPTVVYNKQMLPGGWNNRVGAAMGTLGNPNEAIASSFRPADMSAQVLQMIHASIDITRDTMGASDAALGNVRPDNTSAIIATQKASGMPLELQRMEFYRFVEDCIRVFLDMMAVNYGLRKVWLANPETGKEKEETVDFDTLKEVRTKLNIDVGASTYWSELMQINTIDNLYAMGIIADPALYIESVPKGYIPNRNKILEALEKSKDAMPPMGEAMLPPMGEAGLPPMEGMGALPQQMPIQGGQALPPELMAMLGG
jgi:hypothetical protein